MNDEITRALTAVLEPARGKTLPMRAIHRAVIAHMGHSPGASYKALKSTLRAAGVVVTTLGRGTEHFAHGVTLAPAHDFELRNPRGSAKN